MPFGQYSKHANLADASIAFCVTSPSSLSFISAAITSVSSGRSVLVLYRTTPKASKDYCTVMHYVTRSPKDKGDLGNSWKRSDCTTRQLKKEIVHLYRKYELFERTSVFVCFALRMQAKPYETE